MKNKKVFITGITGFKGSWLALMCNELGANVYGLGLEENRPNHIYNKAKINEIATVYIEDIRNILNSDTKEIIKDCDYVFHLAAQPLVSESYKDPVYTYETNVLGTTYIHQLLCDSDKPISFINVTTDKVYKPKDRALVETDELGANDPYSLSKALADQISTNYVENFLPDYIYTTSARAGNVIGGGDISENRIMTDLMYHIFEDKQLSLRNPLSVRPYQYVLDCLNAYIMIAEWQLEKKITGEKFNVGPNKNTIVTTEDLINSSNYEINYDTNGESIGKETNFLMLDNSKIKNQIGWFSKYNDIKDVTNKTLDWFNANYNNENMQQYSINEVKEFLRR